MQQKMGRRKRKDQRELGIGLSIPAASQADLFVIY